MIKVVGTILFGVLALALLSDLYVVNTVYNKAARSIEHALDAGIVQSTLSEEAKQGAIRVNAQLTEATRKVFQNNMGLNENLENKVLKSSHFQLKRQYNKEFDARVNSRGRLDGRNREKNQRTVST